MIFKIDIDHSDLQPLKDFLSSEKNKFRAPEGFRFLTAMKIDGIFSPARLDTLPLAWMPNPPKNYGGFLAATIFTRDCARILRDDEAPSESQIYLTPMPALQDFFNAVRRFPKEATILDPRAVENLFHSFA